MKAKRIGIAIFVLSIVPILVFARGDRTPPPRDASAPTQDGEAYIVINELLPNPAAGEHEWVELRNAHLHLIYLPMILRHSGGGAAAVAFSDWAAALDGVEISGWEITDEDGNTYTIPAALPPVPSNGYVLIYFDGQGAAADDYDFSDGVAVLHSPPGLVDIFEDEADQVALYRGSAHSPDTLHDFLAYGDVPGVDADNAVAAGLWDPSWWVSTYIGSGAEDEEAPPAAGRSIGRYPGRSDRTPEAWAVYQGDDITPGAANPVPGTYWSTVADGAVMSSDGFALGWGLVPGATYRFQMDDDPAFGSPLVDELLDTPSYAPADPLPAGDYWWRVQAIDPVSGPGAWSAPMSVGVVAVTAAHAALDADAAQPVAQQQVLPMTWLRQRKDTPLLCLDGDNEGNPSAPSPKQTWDAVHPDAIYVHGQNNCVRASIAMIVTNYGGSLSQDRISYEYFERYGSPIKDWGGVGDPHKDLGHNMTTIVCGSDGASGGTLFAWALGLSKSAIHYAGGKPTFTQVRNWIDAGRPIMRFDGVSHQTVIGGYRVLADSTEQVRLFDPWSAVSWQNYSGLNIGCHYVPPASAPGVRSDEPGIWTDSDGDGVMDWDEQVRFHTRSDLPDTEEDWVNDKQDIREYVFNSSGTYSLRAADLDGDSLRKELDPDSDGGGTVDGCEDSDHDGVRDTGETDNFNASDDTACVPAFEIRSPVNGSPSDVGDKTAPDKLLIRVLAAVPPAAGPLVLSTGDFDVGIGGDAASIVVPPYGVGDEYWLIVQPPAKTTAGLYSLSVTLQGTQTDTESNAVQYSDTPRSPVDEVLVVDNSGSMAYYNKMPSAKNAARAFIDRWKTDDMVGLVAFSTTVSIPYPLTTVTGPGTLSSAKTAINDMSDTPPGSWLTAVGSGLLTAKSQLDSAGSGHAQSIVVLSDGMENVDPKWGDPSSGVQAAFTGCSIKVHTVSIGPSTASWRARMQHISEHACNGDGEAWHTSGGDTSPTLFSAQAAGFPGDLGNRLADIYLSIAELDAHHQRLWEATGILGQEFPDVYSVYVPKGLPEAIWTLNWDQGVAELQLYDPDGNLVKAGDPRVTRNQDDTHDQFRIGTPPDGTWQVELHNLEPQYTPEYLAVLSANSDVQMWLYLGLISLDRAVGMQMPIAVALADHAPIAGAVVSATIKAPNEQFDVELQLFDDGNHGDSKPDDGLYGNFYDLRYPGSYTIKAVGVGVDNDGEPFERYLTRSFYVYPRLAYVFNAESPTAIATAFDYQALLDRNGFRVHLIPLQAITADINFFDYQLIIVGPETGEMGAWGTDEAIRVIDDAERPVIGLGEGGYAFFGQLDLSIGHPYGEQTAGQAVYAVDPGQEHWTDPYPIRMPRDQIVDIHYDPTPMVEIPFVDPPGGVTLIGRNPESGDTYPVVQQSLAAAYGEFLLWGFGGSPVGMTQTGQEWFVNLVWYME